MMRIDSEPMTIPVIALRGLTVFPNVLIHFEVTRETSVRALEAAMSEGTPIFLVAQRDMMVEEPEADDLYRTGTISNIRQILRPAGSAGALPPGRGAGDHTPSRPEKRPDGGPDACHL